jgi:hypothetical protein
MGALRGSTGTGVTVGRDDREQSATGATMSDDAVREDERDDQVGEEKASADRTNGERPETDNERSSTGPEGSDPDAPGRYVDDDDAAAVAEPNEPA